VPQGNADQVFPVFFGVWVVLGLFSTGFFYFNKNAVLKRKVWPPFLGAVGILFLGFMWAMGVPPETFFLAVPAVALITLLNLRIMRFCNSCGATLKSQNPFAKPAFCSKCGAKLEQ